MKKLSTEQENAVRDVARQCSDAIKKALKKNLSQAGTRLYLQS